MFGLTFSLPEEVAWLPSGTIRGELLCLFRGAAADAKLNLFVNPVPLVLFFPLPPLGGLSAISLVAKPPPIPCPRACCFLALPRTFRGFLPSLDLLLVPLPLFLGGEVISPSSSLPLLDLRFPGSVRGPLCSAEQFPPMPFGVERINWKASCRST